MASGSKLCRSLDSLSKYRLDNEAEGCTQNRNPRSHTIEPKRKACGLYMASRVSMERRSHWPSCLTDLEYSNRCYADNAAEVFVYKPLHASPWHACFVKPSDDRWDCTLTPWR